MRIILIIVILCSCAHLINAQDSIRKNTIGFSSIHSLNGVFKNTRSIDGEKISNGYNTSFEMFYDRNIYKKIGLIFNLATEKREHEISNTLFKSYVPLGPHGSNWGYTSYRSDIVSKQFFLTLGINPYYAIVLKKTFAIKGLVGFYYSTPIKQTFYSTSNFDPELGNSSSLSPTNNYRLNASLKFEHSFKNRFTFSYAPFYDYFLTKTKSNGYFETDAFTSAGSMAGGNLRYYSFGLKFGLGYKW